MTPIEDFHARDLAWISDFVMQQMIIMLRPMMEHLQQTDATVDYAQHTVQRLSMDVSEARGDLERTNKYLAILRQGLGVQNEGKCVLQRGLESIARTVKRMDDQMEGLLEAFRGVEGAVGRLTSDVRASGVRQDDLARQVAQNVSTLESLQIKVDRASSEACPGFQAAGVKDELLNNDARFEVWQRELRELRRSQLGVGMKLDDKASCPSASAQGGRGLESAWPSKSKFPPSAVDRDVAGGGGKGGATVFHGDMAVSSGDKAGAAGQGSVAREPRAGGHCGHGQQSKRLSRVGSGSGRVSLLQQDPGRPGSGRVSLLQQNPGAEMAHNTSNEVLSASSLGASHMAMAAAAAQEEPVSPGLPHRGGRSGREHGEASMASSGSRLPLLAGARQSAAAVRPPESGYSEGPRLRFSATMVSAPSRGSPT